MADSTISDLAAVTDLLTTDDYVLMRSGVTKRITGDDLATEILALAPGGGGLTLIDTQVLGSNTATVTFSSIPSTYEHLKLVWQGRTSATIEALRMRFNSDTGSNYDFEQYVGSNTTAAAGGAFAGTSLFLGELNGTGETAQRFSSGVADFPFYKQTTAYKHLVFQFQDIRNATSHAGSGGGMWRNTAAITDIALFAASGNLVTGSAFSLYGVE